MLESLWRMQVVMSLMQVCTQKTTFGEKGYSCSGWRTDGSNNGFSCQSGEERDDDTSVYERQPKGKSREKRPKARAKTKVLKEEIACTWDHERQCSHGDSCAFKHEPSKNNQEKESRLIILLRRAPCTRNSKGDGKGERGCRTSSDWNKSFWETGQTTFSRIHKKNTARIDLLVTSGIDVNVTKSTLRAGAGTVKDVFSDVSKERCLLEETICKHGNEYPTISKFDNIIHCLWSFTLPMNLHDLLLTEHVRHHCCTSPSRFLNTFPLWLGCGHVVAEVSLTSSKDPAAWWRWGNLPSRSRTLTSFVKHVYREQNQEADHWANIGAQGRRKTVNRQTKCFRNMEGRYGASGMEASKDNGRSGRGIVI